MNGSWQCGRAPSIAAAICGSSQWPWASRKPVVYTLPANAELFDLLESAEGPRIEWVFRA